MIQSKDIIPEYIPNNTKLILLGTMCSVNAREIDGVVKNAPPFFYHDNRNRFWKILQYLLEDIDNPPFLSVAEKKAYLEKWGVAIGNVVDTMELKKGECNDASDEIIYSAFKKNRVLTKKVRPKFRKLLQTKPLFFTCKRKPKLDRLLLDYFKKNKVAPARLEEVVFLHTPTRKAHATLAEIWRQDFLSAF